MSKEQTNNALPSKTHGFGGVSLASSAGPKMSPFSFPPSRGPHRLDWSERARYYCVEFCCVTHTTAVAVPGDPSTPLEAQGRARRRRRRRARATSTAGAATLTPGELRRVLSRREAGGAGGRRQNGHALRPPPPPSYNRSTAQQLKQVDDGGGGGGGGGGAWPLDIGASNIKASHLEGALSPNGHARATSPAPPASRLRSSRRGWQLRRLLSRREAGAAGVDAERPCAPAAVVEQLWRLLAVAKPTLSSIACVSSSRSCSPGAASSSAAAAAAAPAT